MHDHQPRRNERASLFLGEVAPYDHVGITRLILERHKGHTACRAKALPTGHEASHANVTVRADVFKIFSAVRAFEQSAQQFEWMQAQAEPSAAEVVDNFLPKCWGS